MTTSPAAHAKSRGTFGGWRAQRPFWGGLFLILSGIELFLSGNLQLAIEVHFGPLRSFVLANSAYRAGAAEDPFVDPRCPMHAAGITAPLS